MVDETVVEVLTTQVGVTGCGLDLEDALLDSQERHIEGSSTEIEDQHIALARHLLVETVSDGGGGGFVDDTEHVQAADDAGVLRRLALRVVEVGGNGDDGLGDCRAEVGLRGLLHLREDHRGDLFGRELLRLATVLDGDVRLAGLVDDFEGEVLDVRLDLGVFVPTADETLRVEDTAYMNEYNKR